MTQKSAQLPSRLLDPIDRISEWLFGLIMVLTFTSAISVSQADRQELRTMVAGAIGCNLGWDDPMFVFAVWVYL